MLWSERGNGRIAQLAERQLHMLEVASSSLAVSTRSCGETGKHGRLKPCCLRAYEFDSRRDHQMEGCLSWLKGLASKAMRLKGHGSSNLSPSAR